MDLPAVAAVLTALAGASLVYAGARHQRLLDTTRPRLRWIGWALLLAALVVLLGTFGIAAAIFIWIAVAMLVWSTIPLIAAWHASRRKGSG